MANTHLIILVFKLNILINNMVSYYQHIQFINFFYQDTAAADFKCHWLVKQLPIQKAAEC